MIKLIFKAFKENSNADFRNPVYSDHQGNYYTEVMADDFTKILHKNVPFNEFEGALGERVEEEYEVYDENVICGFCECFFEKGCKYVGDLGCNQRYACEDCIKNELSSSNDERSNDELVSRPCLMPVKTLVSDNKLDTYFDLANISQRVQKHIKKLFRLDESMILFINEDIMDKLGYVYRVSESTAEFINEAKYMEAYSALLDTFVEECEALPPGGEKIIDYAGKRIVIWKDEEYKELFDVIFTLNGHGDDDDIYDGTHLYELGVLIENLLFQNFSK